MVGKQLLLDTNCFLWAAAESNRLSKTASKALSDPGTILLVSLCSVWEMQIKHQLGKLPLPARADLVAVDFARSLKAEFLPVTIGHIGTLHGLPDVHRDPFDRMIVAQAIAENLRILSPDPVLREYPATVIW